MADAQRMPPCANCGEAQLEREEMAEHSGMFRIVCMTCGANSGYHFMEDAEKAWSRRSPATPASAARLLLESPEAVERMAEISTDHVAAADEVFLKWADVPEDIREIMRDGLTAALRSIAGEEG